MSTNPHTAEAAALMQSHKDQLAAGTFTLADDAEYFTRATWVDEAVKPLVMIERAIIRRTCIYLIERGHPLRVHNGEEYLIGKAGSTDINQIMGLIMQTDEDRIYVLGRPGSDDPTYNASGTKAFLGSIVLIYGNDGWDVMADCSQSLADILEEQYDFAEAIGEELWKEVP